MILTGYHGASHIRSDEIEATRKFHISTAQKDWLANGIYFYFNFEDAYNWKGTSGNETSESVFHALVSVTDDEYLDFDTEDGRILYSKVVEYLAATHDKRIDPNAAQKNQCAVIQTIWDANPQLMVMACSFSPVRTVFQTKYDYRPVRKEFCVRNNLPIIYIHRIRRGDIDGKC